MTEEEYFRKNYPDFCYGDKPLSPYWDLFQYGVEFGERQSEKKIEELTSELTNSLVEQMAKLEEENAELKEQNNHLYNDLTMTEAENAELKKKLEYWKSEYEKLFNED